MKELTGYQRFLILKAVDRLDRMRTADDEELAKRFESEITETEKQLLSTGLSREQIKEFVNAEVDKTHG